MQYIRTIGGWGNNPKIVKFSRNSAYVAISEMKKCYVYHISTGALVLTVTMENNVSSYCFSPDSTLIAVQDSLANIDIRDIKTGEVVLITDYWTGNQAMDIDIDPSNESFIITTNTMITQAYMKDGTLKKNFGPLNTQSWSCKFSLDGAYIAASSSSDIKIFDTVTGSIVKSILFTNTYFLAWHPTLSNAIVLVTYTKVLLITFNPPRPDKNWVISGNLGYYNIGFSLDGSLFLAGSKVYDVTYTPKVIDECVLRSPENSFLSLGISPSGKYVAAVELDATNKTHILLYRIGQSTRYRTSFNTGQLLSNVADGQSSIIESVVEETGTGATVTNTEVEVELIDDTVTLTSNGATVVNNCENGFDAVTFTSTGATVVNKEPVSEEIIFTSTGATVVVRHVTPTLVYRFNQPSTNQG